MISCDDFNKLVERARVADLDDEEWDRFVNHENDCSIHGPAAAQRQPSDEALLRNCLALLDREIPPQPPPERRWFQVRLNQEALVAAAMIQLLLIGGALGVALRPKEKLAEPPLPTAEVAVPPTPAPLAAAEPVPSPSVAFPSKSAKPAPAPIYLEVRSEPAGQIKLLRAGKPLGEGVGQIAARVTPGPLEVEVSSRDKPVFFKRVALTIAPSPIRQAHTISVEQGMVSIRAFPSSHVEIDGGPSVSVPLQQSLYEGTHLLRFECDRDRACAGRAPEMKQVTVYPGETVDVGQIWQ